MIDLLRSFVAQFAHLGPEMAPRAIVAAWRQLSISERAAIVLRLRAEERGAAERP
ncbi:MAG TPA: hypothetical protein VE987_22255 [Polyangiaceae bacterium]|nr:hypothetical protein [Polyangiaceae bacterium]